MNYDVFISYSRKDTAVADRVCAAFDRAGISYFIDRQGIGGGLEFPEILAEAIVGCRKVLFLASANSYASKFTNSEIAFAFNKKEKNSIIPYCIDDCEMPIGLQFVFSGINWRTLREHPIESVLVDDVLGMLGRPRISAPAPAPESERGLETSVRTDPLAGSPVAAAAAPVAVGRIYAIGDYYNENGKEGIVFEVDETGRRGKIMGLRKSEQRLAWSLGGGIETPDMFDGSANQRDIEKIDGWREKYPVFAWCAAQGEDWYLPASEELLAIYRHRRQLVATCAEQGGDKDLEWVYWSSTGLMVDCMNGTVLRDRMKSKPNYVRAVSVFSAGEPVVSAVPEVPAAAERSAARRYSVGDYYEENGKRGVVFEVDPAGRHGKIVALNDAPYLSRWQRRTDTLVVRTIDKSEDGPAALNEVRLLPDWKEKYPAFAYCASLGDGWYLPTLEDLRLLYELRKSLSAVFGEHGGAALSSGRYWSCGDYGRNAHMLVFANGYAFSDDKSKEHSVRAVALF